MLYNFYPKFKCQYSEDALLIFGKFYGEKPCWHYVRDAENWRLEALEEIPSTKDGLTDKSGLIYRVPGRDGNRLRFSHSKMRRISIPWPDGGIIKAIREDLIP